MKDTADEETQTGPETRDYFAEMYVAAVLADAGWDVYFPRRDKGFDMIVSRPAGATTIVRPVQVKGKYATDAKTNKAVYGYVGNISAFHDDMILAIPYFNSKSADAPLMIAWMPRYALKPHKRGWKCEPAKYVNGAPEPRPGYDYFFDAPGLMRFEAEVGQSILPSTTGASDSTRRP